MQIKDVLKGYTVDRKNIQSVANMTVIPIISETEFTNVADVNEVTLKQDVAYNSMEFQNSSGHIGIVLQGWTMIEPNQKAQDRTIPFGKLLNSKTSKAVPANCVQSRQCGTFDCTKLDQSSFKILPPSLRGIALKKNTDRSADTGTLWESLSKWSNKIDCKNDGLFMFYSKFEDKLSQFVAQFEPVEKQVGAIVFINNELIAIDIMPKYDSWKKLWRALIRDSYGAEAIRLADNGTSVEINPSINAASVSSLDDLVAAYSTMKNDFYGNLESAINSSISAEVTSSKLDNINELTMLKLENSDFIGQGVAHGNDHYIYLSLVSSKGEKAPIQKLKSLRNDPYAGSSFSFR
jgi:hypothetical protein